MQMMKLEKFGDRMIDLFPKIARGIARYENNYLTKGVITLPQVWTLSCLSKHRLCQMRELAESMSLKLSSMTGLTDRLERQGLVKRRRAESDGRIVHVRITLKGRKVLRQIYDQKRKGIIRLYGQLSGKERFQYLQILEKLAASLSAEDCNAKRQRSVYGRK